MIQIKTGKIRKMIKKRKYEREKLILKKEDVEFLVSISKSTVKLNAYNKKRKIIAKIFLLYSEEHKIPDIAKMVGISKPTVYKYIDMALDNGYESIINFHPKNKEKIYAPTPNYIKKFGAKYYLIKLKNAIFG